MQRGSIERIGDPPIAMPVSRERLDWLDALKGIGIIAVVAGHLWTRGALRNAIYDFHMPLFFMASGAVARAVPMGKLAPRLLLALGLPALSFAILFLGLDFLIEGWRGAPPIFPDFWTGVRMVLFHTEQLRGPFAILWFAPCLIMARLVWNALSARFDPMGLPMALVMGLVLLIALAADRHGGASPLGLLPVPAAILFLWLGAHWRARPFGILAGVTLLLVAIVVLAWMPPLNLRAGDIGFPVIGIFGAAAIVDRLGWLVRHLPGKLSRLFGWLGRNSLVIMFVHLCFTHYLWLHATKPVLLIVAIAGALMVGALLRRNWLLRLAFLGER